MPGRHREAWNDEDIATLRRMAQAGDDITAIARALERSREAVSKRALKLGVVIARGAARND